MKYFIVLSLLIVSFCGQIKSMETSPKEYTPEERKKIDAFIVEVKKKAPKYSLKSLVDKINAARPHSALLYIYVTEAINRIKNIIDNFYIIKQKHAEWMYKNKGWNYHFQSNLPKIQIDDYNAFVWLNPDKSDEIKKRFFKEISEPAWLSRKKLEYAPDWRLKIYTIIDNDKTLMSIAARLLINDLQSKWHSILEKVNVENQSIKDMFDNMKKSICEYFKKHKIDVEYEKHGKSMTLDVFCLIWSKSVLERNKKQIPRGYRKRK